MSLKIIAGGLRNLAGVVNGDLLVNGQLDLAGPIIISGNAIPGGDPTGRLLFESFNVAQGDGRIQLARQSEDTTHPLAQIKLWIASSDIANFNPGVRTYKAKGSFAAPIILDNLNTMGSWEARGFVVAGAGPDADGFVTQCYFIAQTTEAWVANVAHGCGWSFSATPNGSTVVVPILQVNGQRVQVLGAGLLDVGSNAITGVFNINGPAGTVRGMNILTAGAKRWDIIANSTAEGGADTGSPLRIDAYNDAGALIDAPIIILRVAGGVLTVGRPLYLANNYMDFDEMADQPNPAANRARLFSKDSGGGKTQLCVRFPTGVTQVIATEP